MNARMQPESLVNQAVSGSDSISLCRIKKRYRASGGLKNSVAVVIIKVARRKKAVLSVTSDYAARDKGRVVVDTTVINGS